MKAVAMDEHNENVDHDILKGREDILRARKKAAPQNPLQKKENSERSSSQSHNADTSEKKSTENAPQEPSPMMKAVVDANKQKRNESKAPNVPVFDVSRKILARQRQTAAAKRTAPLKFNPPGPGKSAYIPARKDQIEYKKPSYNSLVAEIVARDIDMFCRGQSATS